MMLRPAAITLALALSLSGCGRSADAQAGGKAVPYKLGTFDRNGQAFVGLVINDTQVADVGAANTAWEGKNASAPKLAAPRDMHDLIARFDSEWKTRLAALAADVATAASAPAYVTQVSALKVLPPVRPSLILNAGGNYVEHMQGIAQQQQRASGGKPAAPPPPAAVSAPGIWERPAGDTRDNPYLFLKSPTVVVGANDPIVMPRGRERIDYECEFNVVIGKKAKYVPIDRANDYIFGYTIQIDVSDRGGRGDQKMGGSDWLVGKNHDTFGPIGPFIVPREFVKDPKNVRHTFTLNDTVMQDSNTSRMSHNVFELLHYASNILTLNPGDLISGGSPAGTNIERAEPRWMRAGDTAICTIEGIGTQRHAVVAEPGT
jgi:2-keto-4-pentenoate hydratase/2-oxohepta-3-ene-1,7-dioic acid hydratase in catechol pathway